MNKIALITLLMLSLCAGDVVARPGYRIHLKMQGVKDSMVFLAHYYGKPMPTIFKRDSARFDKKGNAEFKSDDETFVGGIYMMLLSDRKTYFEILLNNGDDFSIVAPIDNLPEGIKFTNSPVNDDFRAYTDFLKGYAATQQAFEKEFKAAKTLADSQAVRKKSSGSSKVLINYRREYLKTHPNSLLSVIFKGLEIPQVPEGPHLLEDGKTKDSAFSYRYYKGHFWDGYDFQDDRLVHAPIIDAKLDEYFNKLVMPWPDSIEHEADILLKKAKGTKHNFKYVLWWLTRYAENSKVMGMDEALVYLVENYYMKGDAFWLSNEELVKYEDRAMKIAPNVLGNVAPVMKLPNVMTANEEILHSGKAKYTLVVFYSPTCGHCQTEIPSIDSLYRKVLKAKGCKVFTVATEGDEKAIKDFITKNKLEDWTNTWDPGRTGDWRGKYDVYSTPSIYLLDERKIIRGKKLDHSNIGSLLDMLEQKEKNKK